MKNNKLGRGRPKNSGNKSTAETKTLLHTIVGNQLDEVEDLLNKLEPKEKLDAIIKLLPYVLPRQTEIVIDKEPIFTPIEINLLK